MRKILTTALVALTVAGGVASAATTAQAEPYRHYDRHRGKKDNTGAAIAAGIVGLALGAAIVGSSNNNNRRSSSSYYNNGYAYQPDYNGGYYGDNGYYNNGYANGGYNNGYANNGYYGGRQPYGYAPNSYAYGSRVCTSRERVYDRYSGRPITVTRQYAC